jgi:hypothetical protein
LLTQLRWQWLTSNRASSKIQMLAKKGGSIKTEWLGTGVVHKILLPMPRS